MFGISGWQTVPPDGSNRVSRSSHRDFGIGSGIAGQFAGAANYPVTFKASCAGSAMDATAAIPSFFVLVQAAADTTHAQDLHALQNFSQMDTIQKRCAWIRFAINGNVSVIGFCLSNGATAEIVNSMNAAGENALIRAAARGDVECVGMLLNVDGIDVNAVDRYGATARDRAGCRAGPQAARIVAWLIAAEAIASTTPIPADDPALQIVTACYGDPAGSEQSVLRHRVLHSIALFHALGRRNLTVARKLLSMPDLDVNWRCEDGHTVLSLAVQQKRKNFVALLLADARTDVNLDAPFIKAALAGHALIGEMLLRDPRTSFEQQLASVPALTDGEQKRLHQIVMWAFIKQPNHFIKNSRKSGLV